VGRFCLLAFAVASAACTVDGLELAGKQCPCVEGYSCDERQNLCVLGAFDASISLDGSVEDASDTRPTAADTKVTDAKLDAPPAGPDCSVHADGKLYCTNKSPANIRATPNNTATIVDQLTTDYSWFTCWTTGQLHAGDNTTWYYTLGDNNGKWGYVAANDTNTTSAFDANPTTYGLKKCP